MPHNLTPLGRAGMIRVDCYFLTLIPFPLPPSHQSHVSRQVCCDKTRDSAPSPYPPNVQQLGIYRNTSDLWCATNHSQEPHLTSDRFLYIAYKRISSSVRVKTFLMLYDDTILFHRRNIASSIILMNANTRSHEFLY